MSPATRHAKRRRLTGGVCATVDLVAGLLLLGVGQGLFLAILLLLRPQLRTPANWFLAALVAALALSCVSAALRAADVARPVSTAVAFLALLPLYGPLLRFHLDALFAQGEWRFERRHRRWLVTPVVGILLVLGFTLLAGPSVMTILTDGDVLPTPRNLSALIALVVLHLLAASQQCAAIIWGVRRTRRIDRLDDSTRSRLVWVRGVLIIAFVCWLAFAASLVAGFVDGALADKTEGWASLLYAASLYGLGLLGLARPDTLLPAPGQVVAAILEPARTPKYARSALTDEDARRIASKIEDVLRRSQPHLDPTLTLAKLAQMIGASTNDVSQAINTQLGGSYHELIARWRIEEAKRLLADPSDGVNVLEVCYAVGFNSKSVFNSAFKRLTDKTPSAFRADILSRSG